MRFPRRFRLKRRRLIRPLFDRTRADVFSVSAGCIRLVARKAGPEAVGERTPVQVGFAPGRQARTAVARNRIKRRLRETFRTHQAPLLAALADRPDTLTLMVLYRSDPASADQIPRDLPRALDRLIRQLSDSEPVAKS